MQPARVLPESPFSTQNLENRFIQFLESGAANRLLYRHQIQAVLAVTAQFQGSSKQNIALVVLPTGCGKTGVAVLCSYALSSKRVLVITPSENVSKQIHQAFCGKQSPNPVEPFLIARGVFQVTSEDEGYVIPIGAFINRSTNIRRAHFQNHVVVVNAHKVGGQSSVGIDEIPKKAYDLVIVDEAHHYPAETWKRLVDHFDDSKRLFLTATPEWRGKSILTHLNLPPIHLCYCLSLNDAIKQEIIRKIEFEEILDGEADPMDNTAVYEATAAHIEYHLNQHDRDGGLHQAMVLTQERVAGGRNAAEDFVAAYRGRFPHSRCEAYITGTPRVVLEQFKSGEIRTLVVIGRLLEGFDHKHISVVGIVRNVAPSSRVLFAQFIGRAVRKISPQDKITAMVVAHSRFNQKENYDAFDRTIAEVEPMDEAYY